MENNKPKITREEVLRVARLAQAGVVFVTGKEISPIEVLHVARLARIGVSDEDVDKITRQLSNILENFTALQQLDTEGVPPTAQSIPLVNVMKLDEVRPSLPQEDVLKNAPKIEGEFIRIRAVMEN